MNTKLTNKQRTKRAIELANKIFELSIKVLFEVKPSTKEDFQSFYGDYNPDKGLMLIEANNNLLNVPYSILVMGNVDKETITKTIKEFNDRINEIAKQLNN